MSCDYLASPEAGSPQGFCYLGPVFRDRGAMPAEFLQAGIESFGRPDKAAADAEMLALGLDATAHYGIASPEIRMGDVGLFAALVAALDLAPAWKRRLVKDFNRKTSLAHDLDVLTLSSASNSRSIRACSPRSRAPIPRPRTRWSPICSRSPASPRSAAARSARSPSASSNRRRSARPTRCRARRAPLIERFLAIAGDPDEAAAELRALAADAELSISAALDLFESRTGFLAARGVDVGRIRFSTAFGRGLDYYTGFVFELHDTVGKRRTGRWSPAAATTNC